MIYCDSILHPFVQGKLVTPAEIGVNCTLGGALHHIEEEMKEDKRKNRNREPDVVAIFGGTNNLGKCSVYHTYSKLVDTAKELFPSSKVC